MPISKDDNKSSPKKHKEFWLSSFSLRNSTSVMVLVVLFLFMGIQSYILTPKEAQPNITIPFISVITTYPGVSPHDMETQVTRYLEDDLGDISTIKNMTSFSSEGYSNVTLEFDTGIDMDEALQKVREKVDLAEPELPTDANEPIIVEINFSEFPIMQVNIASNLELAPLTILAEIIQERLEAIPSVLEAELVGGIEKEVKVDVSLDKLRYYNLALSDVIMAIQSENISFPGGSIDSGTKRFFVRIPGEYVDPEPIKDIVVLTKEERPIYIRDLADVTFGPIEQESYATLNDRRIVSLNIKKRSGKNIIETAAEVRQVIDQVEPTLPAGTFIEITSDRSTFVIDMVGTLENSIISGFLLVWGVLLFFLGIRTASFVSIAIPLSMLISFIVISMLGMSLNMIVLFSLILALGMLVDNSIVVVENIYRYMESGYSHLEAAKMGTGEVAIPIISGTATTLVAFLPTDVLAWYHR